MKNVLDKAMLFGLFLSKFDKDALIAFGFKTYTEAFNIIGYTLSVKPITIRNYRDEFDPYFPNKRKGWYQREMFPSRKEMYEKYKDLGLNEFVLVIKSEIFPNPQINFLTEKVEAQVDNFTYAKRLLTGLAAEEFFKEKYQEIEIFKGLTLEDTTKLGCGFDFKLNIDNYFYAVEVKGLSLKQGNILITEKEYNIANLLGENYFVFLVKNFDKEPEYKLFNNPVNNKELNLKIKESIIVQTNWFSDLII